MLQLLRLRVAVRQRAIVTVARGSGGADHSPALGGGCRAVILRHEEVGGVVVRAA